MEIHFRFAEQFVKTVQEELTLTRIRTPATVHYWADKGWRITQKYRYQTAIEYHKKYTLNWIQCEETRKKDNQTKTSCFEYVTNIEANRDNVKEIACGGRLRWKIENEGFNTQKCNDYELEHKFCRKSYNGLKNYYSILQIAHAINQLIEKDKLVTAILKLHPKETLRNLWGKLKHYLIFCNPLEIFSSLEDVADNKPAPS